MKTRTSYLLAITCGAVALLLLAVHSVFAQGLPPDPLTQPTDTLSLFSKLYHSGAYVAIAILGAFYLLRLAGLHQWKPNITHWLAIAAGVVALFVPSALQGQTPNVGMLVGFIVPILALVAPGLVPAPKQAQAGCVRLGTMLAIVGVCACLMAADGCHSTQVPVPVADVIDCIKIETGVDLTALKAQLQQDVDAHDWSKLVSDAAAAAPGLSTAPSQGLAIASCVATELVQQYLAQKQANGSATWGAHDAVEQLRAKLSAPGKSVTFRTALGDL